MTSLAGVPPTAGFYAKLVVLSATVNAGQIWLAVAAVLQQKGMLTIVLILGLTGWTGVFRLIRAEYLKHKGREYVMAADALGAMGAKRALAEIGLEIGVAADACEQVVLGNLGLDQ